MNLLKDLYRLFLPSVCAMCGEHLNDGVEFICMECRGELPHTGFCRSVDNPVARRFYGHFPVVAASAFLWFGEGGDVRRMIHDLKYRGRWRNGSKAGEWYGAELRECGMYADVELVVPVPLHFRKLLMRGYNQAEYIAAGISKSLGARVETKSVVRSRYNRSQTKRHKSERWDNVEGIFSIKHPARLAGKHILLVDDVLTTGATIISCARAIALAVPDCRISVAVLAASRAEYGDFKK